jgi:hypothetical protein
MTGKRKNREMALFVELSGGQGPAAQKLGISRPMLNLMLHGHRYPSRGLMVKMKQVWPEMRLEGVLEIPGYIRNQI